VLELPPADAIQVAVWVPSGPDRDRATLRVTTEAGEVLPDVVGRPVPDGEGGFQTFELDVAGLRGNVCICWISETVLVHIAGPCDLALLRDALVAGEVQRAHQVMGPHRDEQESTTHGADEASPESLSELRPDVELPSDYALAVKPGLAES
jgi:hypothetical protein